MIVGPAAAPVIAISKEKKGTVHLTNQPTESHSSPVGREHYYALASREQSIIHVESMRCRGGQTRKRSRGEIKADKKGHTVEP